MVGYIDWVLTSIFTVELLMNFIADFFFPFFRSDEFVRCRRSDRLHSLQCTTRWRNKLCPYCSVLGVVVC